MTRERKIHKWNLPLTYEPKIKPVRNGTCTQTIRVGRKFNVGDLLRFYIWEGRPYRSKRETITDYMQITTIFKCKIYPYGIMSDPLDGKAGVSYNPWYNLSELARLDGMVPPTGNTLRDVLISKNGQISKDGIEAQIIRWEKPSGRYGKRNNETVEDYQIRVDEEETWDRLSGDGYGTG